MIFVNVRIAERVHEIADAEPANLRDHVREQRVARNVERHAEKKIRAALVKLAAEATVPANVKLKQRVARRERNAIRLGRIPAGNDEPTRCGIAADFFDQRGNLIDAVVLKSAVGVFRCAEVAPLRVPATTRCPCVRRETKTALE